MVSRPATPGLDFCGRIKAKHASNNTFKEGQLVFGTLDEPGKYGTLGQYVVNLSSECATVPEGIEPDQAAAVGKAGMTAFQALGVLIRRTGTVLDLTLKMTVMDMGRKAVEGVGVDTEAAGMTIAG